MAIISDKREATDQDFSSFLSFKDGKIDVDYSSAILLYGYFNDRADWYDLIKEKERMDFEYRSYVEFSSALFSQLFNLITNFTLATDKSTRVNIIKNMKIICSQINSFCKGNIQNITLGERLNLITDNHLRGDAFEVWSKIIMPLQNDLTDLQLQESNYYKLYKQDIQRRQNILLKNLPDEVRNASTLVVDKLKEKEDNVRRFYDRVHIHSAYLSLTEAIKKENPKDIDDAIENILEQCDFVNECGTSFFRGNLGPEFRFKTREALIEHIKYANADLSIELENIDMFTRGEKKAKLLSLKESSFAYIQETINFAKKVGLLDSSFNLAQICNANKEMEIVNGEELKEKHFVSTM